MMPPLQLEKTFKNSVCKWPCLAGALNAGKPVKKPQAYGASDVENHLADLHLHLAVNCCRRHYASPSLDKIMIEACEILDTQKPVCY
jgi:hypothetical protein